MEIVRLLSGRWGDGFWNMAVDEAILIQVEKGVSPPTLRFYGWKPPAVSLGVRQGIDTVDREACRDLGIDVVRRPTGGGALLHQKEVTYSFCLRDDGAIVPRTLLGSYDALVRGLEEGLRVLGVETSRGEEERNRERKERRLAKICFVPTSASDIMAGGKKLVGSAQKRTCSGLLQHGSVILGLDRQLGERVFHLNVGEQEGLLAQVTSLAEILGRSPAFEEVSGALASGFERALGIRFVPGELGPEEERRAKDLARDKYGSQDWTEMKVGRID